MEKKISFGFSKISKKSNLILNKIEPKDEKNKIELIKCLEGQAIQLVKMIEEEAPLIIPLKDGGKTSAALLSLRTRQAVLNGEDILADEKELKTELPPEVNGNGVEDIEKQAARELLAEIRKGDEQDATGSTLVLPLKAKDLPLDGANESTIHDYESIPITQFGKAMLRGMGWKDQPKKKGSLIEEGPVLRPKGMGLGADKALKSKALLVPPESNEILEIKKGACIIVLGGKHKDLYGQVEGLDDHAGRVIVKMALGGIKESFNEFLVQPVSKKEYSQYSKCINSIKYDEYNRMENEYGQIISKNKNIKNQDNKRSDENHHFKIKNSKDDDKIKVSSRRNSTELDYNSQKIELRSRSLDRRDDSRDEEYARCSTSHKKYSSRRTPSRHRSKSNDSRSSSGSISHRSKHKKKSSKSKKSKKSKEKKHEKKHLSHASSDDERRHKKKTKKSKRERSRSRSKVRR